MKFFKRPSENKEEELTKKIENDFGVKVVTSKTIFSKIEDDIKFLSSCVIPKNDEMAVVTDVRAHDGLPVKFPSLRSVPLDINYMVNSLKRRTSNDFGILKVSAKNCRKEILENIRIKYDNEADMFIENHIDKSNSFKALSMRFGYDLLAPRKVDKVEETKKFDERSRRIFKVYNSNILDKYNSIIIGTGAAISDYTGLNCKIEINNLV